MTGIVFTGVGVVNGVASVPLFVAEENCHDVCGIQTLAGLVLVGVGVTMVSIGIPLWAVGSAKVDPRDRDEDEAHLHIGPGRADLEVAF